MVTERVIKYFGYHPGEDIEAADFILSDVDGFTTQGVNLGYNGARIDLLLPELFAEADIGTFGDEILRDGFRKNLLRQPTPWTIMGIQPLPDRLRLRFCHENARLVHEQCDDCLSAEAKDDAKRILQLFDNYETNAVLRYARKEGRSDMSFCLAFGDSESIVCFSAHLNRNCSEVEIENSADGRTMQYLLAWSDDEHTKIRANITRQFKF